MIRIKNRKDLVIPANVNSPLTPSAISKDQVYKRLNTERIKDLMQCRPANINSPLTQLHLKTRFISATPSRRLQITESSINELIAACDIRSFIRT